ncbi:MAG: S46 family peptidase, partial [Candidatus Latescibacterota bacterium]
YYLYTYFKIKDVRIVYAPPKSIGIYGGDEDNWMWPRHTGDFSFLRAYVAPDGKSAEFAEENIPYKPKKHLPFSVASMKEGDFTMVVGYPGSTRRYRSSYSIDYHVNEYYPRSIQLYRDLLDIVEEEAELNPEAGIKVASLIAGLNNGWKNNIGMLEGLKKDDLLGKKIEEQKALTAFMEANPDTKKKYGTVFDEIGAQYDAYREYAELNSLASWMGYAANALRSAYTVYKWSKEHEKQDDLDRDPGYQDRDEPRLKKALELADLRYDEQADKRILKYFLKRCNALPEGQRLRAMEPFTAGRSGDELEHAIDDFVETLYAGTKVTNKEERMKMFGMKKKDLMALKDPMIEFAAELEVEREELEDKSDAFAGAVQKLRPKLMELRRAYSGELLYPDANGTMRLSVGEVKGYAPRDAVSYKFQTFLKGVLEKHTGEEPFDCPEALADLYKAKDFGRYADPATGDVPVCFLSTDDITGGNSGSPILNGKGEVIGVIFDGNYESISADYQYMPDLTRSISVDSRYILFVVDKFAGAEELLSELTIHHGGSL